MEIDQKGVYFDPKPFSYQNKVFIRSMIESIEEIYLWAFYGYYHTL